jgi:putative transposase
VQARVPDPCCALERNIGEFNCQNLGMWHVLEVPRPRKRHLQQSFTYRKRDKNDQFRGGARKNAGRKPKGAYAGAPHKRRAPIDRRHPQHVTVRVSTAIGWLRNFDTYRAIRRALQRVMTSQPAFRIVHFSLQNTHIHLICEANDKRVLAKGMQAFQISAARHLNATLSRRRRKKHSGQVFTDRYHTEDLGSPRQVRNAIAYVLNNWRRHQVDTASPFELFRGRLDPYASGLAFGGWQETVPERDQIYPPEYEPPLVREPVTWLLGRGWTRAKSISMFEVPGPHAIPRVDA